MRELYLVLLSATITIATAILGVFFQKQVWNIVQIVLLENILILVIQVFLKQRDEDSNLSSSLSRVRSDPLLWQSTGALFRAVADSRSHKNSFFSKQLLGFLADSREAVESLNAGILKIDLRPGGFFFREAEAPETAKTTFVATSYVDPGPYWRGPVGARLLARSRKKVEEKVHVTRIFIEEPAAVHGIADIIAQNKAAGVRVKVADSSALDGRLKRDFAILDGGTLAVELVLGDKREPIEVRYYSPDTDSGKKAITELVAVWQRLDELAE